MNQLEKKLPRSGDRRSAHVRAVLAVALSFTLLPATSRQASAAFTDAQGCESAVEAASGKLAACRLRADAAFAKSSDSTKRATARQKCEDAFAKAFAKAVAKYGSGDCSSAPSSAFSGAINRCADEVDTAARHGGFPTCGDGSVNAVGEQCDGADLGGATCTSLGFPGGTLACTPACGFDTTGCDASRIYKTGQTTCFDDDYNKPISCAGSGQDAETQAGTTPVYVDNGDGTITDVKSQLTWEKLSDDDSIHDKDNSYNWHEAVIVHVGTLNAMRFAGHNDWRLPNINELASLRNITYDYPAVYPEFKTSCGDHSGGNPGCTVLTCSCTPPDPFWSSTNWVFPDQAMYLLFYAGEEDPYGKTGTMHARAVRGGL